MTIQTQRGKAFEYACLNSLYNSLCDFQDVEIRASSSYNVARNSFYDLQTELQSSMNMAAEASTRVLIRLEPQLLHPQRNSPLILEIQEDSTGIAGDVRDIISARTQNNWEIGISCKHNHTAVKHSRLSDSIDFGQSWFNTPCSPSYFDEIRPIFAELRDLRGSGIEWRQLHNKDERFYVPILNAFMTELRRLNNEFPGEIPQRFIRYLIGRNDFYKIISIDNRQVTQLQAFNMYGTLNLRSGTANPQVNLPRLSMPNTFFNIDFKPNSRNTILIHCDQGWGISLRIHSASTKVEPSLKFDVNLIGIPPNLYSHHEPWDL